ncbi:MAG: hypothetical protein NTV21_05825 [Planctomycetota bacterium]|nr:hypothetical protein [Planctomycetota bacterium]
MKTLASISLGLVVLLALLVVLLRRPEAEGVSAPEAGVEQAAEETRGALDPTGESTSDAVSRSAIDVEPDAPATSSTSSEPSRLLRGTVVVVDELGRELPEPNGTFLLSLDAEGVVRSQDVQFERGRWEVALEPEGRATTVAVFDAQVGTRFARIESPAEKVVLPESLELVVRLLLPTPPRLRVLDAETGGDLAGITLVRTQAYPLDGLTHPGLDFAERRVASGLASPIELEPYLGQLTLWDELRVLVGVDGHEWGLATIDLLVGGESQIVLRRGGSLSLDVRGASAAPASARLRFREPGQRVPKLDIELGARERLELGGLTPGALSVAAELGSVFENPIVLGETAVGILAGGRTEATLELVPAPEFVASSCAGTLFVHRAWECSSLRFVLRLLDTPARGQDTRNEVEATHVASSRAGFDAFQWNVVDLQAGRYTLEFQHPNLTERVDLPPGRRDDFELVIGAPVELRVRVLDAATGADLRSAHVVWHARRPEKRPTGFEVPSPFSASLERHVVRSAAVPIELWVTVEGYSPSFSELDLSTGITEHTVRLERACAIVLRLKAGDVALTIPSGWSASPTSPSTGGETRMIEFGTSEARFVVSAPGTYELAPPKLPGYKEPPLQRIEVFSGKDTVHVVEYELERP